MHHTEHGAKGEREDTKTTVPLYPFRDGKQLDDFPEGTYYIQVIQRRYTMILML